MKEPSGRALTRCLKGGVVCGVLAAGLGVGVPAKADSDALWVEQIGSSRDDYAYGVATDTHDNVVVAGSTRGSLAPNQNGFDAWVSKYNALGKRLWIQQFGDKNTYGTGVATDRSDNVFVAGYSNGSIGTKNQGGNDAFVVKYNQAGTLLWSKMIGTTSFFEPANGVAADRQGNVMICGYSSGQIGQQKFGDGNDKDAWVAKYNATGRQLWVQQLGTSQDDECNGVATDKNGNVVLTGTTYGPLGGADPKNTGRVPWIAKYNPAGKLLWTRQVPSKVIAYGNSVATDKSNNILVSGTVVGRIVPGPYQHHDAWVAKYSSAGKQLWIRQYGSSKDDSGHGVTADTAGNVFLTGSIAHIPFSSGNVYDAFVRKYSPAGAVIWTHFLDGAGNDHGYAPATDLLGDVYVAGHTNGDLDGRNQGRNDAFLAKFPKN